MSKHSNHSTPTDKALAGSAIQSVLSLCLQCAQKLKEQPLFEGSGSIVKQCKVIQLESHDDAHICALMSEAARKLLDRREIWPIHSFGGPNNSLYSVSGENLGHGVELWLDHSEPGPLETLEKAYRSIAQSLTEGWKLKDPAQHPDVMYKEDPEAFDLLVKTSTVSDEDTLMRFILSKLGMRDSVASCHNRWLTHSHHEARDLIYLWIKKTHTAQVIEQFSLQVGGLDESSESEEDKDDESESQTRSRDTEEPHALGDEIQLTFHYDMNGQTLMNMLDTWRRDSKLGDAKSRERLKRFKQRDPSAWLFFQYMRLAKDGTQRSKLGEICKTLSGAIVKTRLEKQ